MSFPFPTFTLFTTHFIDQLFFSRDMTTEMDVRINRAEARAPPGVQTEPFGKGTSKLPSLLYVRSRTPKKRALATYKSLFFFVTVSFERQLEK